MTNGMKEMGFTCDFDGDKLVWDRLTKINTGQTRSGYLCKLLWIPNRVIVWIGKCEDHLTQESIREDNSSMDANPFIASPLYPSSAALMKITPYEVLSLKNMTKRKEKRLIIRMMGKCERNSWEITWSGD